MWLVMFSKKSIKFLHAGCALALYRENFIQEISGFNLIQRSTFVGIVFIPNFIDKTFNQISFIRIHRKSLASLLAAFLVKLLIGQPNLLITNVYGTTTPLNDQLVLSSLEVIKDIVPRECCLFTHEIFIYLRHANLLANFFSIWNFFLGGITAD